MRHISRWKLISAAAVAAAGLCIYALAKPPAAHSISAAVGAAFPEPIADAGGAGDAGAPISDASAATEPDAARPVSPECARLEAANEALLRGLEHQDAGDGCLFSRPAVGCLTTSTGTTWGYRILSAQARYRGDPEHRTPQTDHLCDTDIDVEMVREDDAGVRAVDGSKETLSYDDQTENRSVLLQELADYDGDGEPEIRRQSETWQMETGPGIINTILTFHAGIASEYPPARKIAIDGVLDVDHDGRQDLISKGPYAAVSAESAFGNERSVAPGIFVYHARPDGSFVLGDRESIAYTESQCPSDAGAPTLSLRDTAYPGKDDAPQVQSLLCARLRGMSRKAIDDAWNAVCAGYDAKCEASVAAVAREVDPEEAKRHLPGKCANYQCRTDNCDVFLCQDWAKQLARVAPPFLLHR